MQVSVLLLLWMISGLLFFIQVKEKYNYWYSGFIFSVGLGILCEIILVNIVPNTANPELFKLIARLLSALSYWLSPYFLLLVGLSVSRLFNEKIKHRLNYILLLPIVISFISNLIFPETGFLTVFLDYSPNFWILVIWGTLYGLIGNFMLIYSYFTEQNLRLKREKLLVCIITVPSLYPIITCYVYPLFSGIHNGPTYNMIPAIFVFVAFIYFAIRFGILGLKITLERQRMDLTVKTVSSGTALLNHILKNEIAKMKICLHGLSDKYKIDLDEDFQFIHVSIDYITQMMNRIQEKTQEITLIIREKEINRIIEEALLQSKPLLESKKITVNNHCKINAVILCDEIHFREVICNLISNSVDAMKERGELNFDIYKNKKELILEIKDNGTGVKKENFPHLFEPFFTTKNRQSNYGLGLTYCFNVMKEHKGNIEIISDEGKGTLVLLKFPLSKVVSMSTAQKHI